MPADRTPHEDISLLGRLLVAVTWLALRFPMTTVVVGVVAAAASLYLTQTRLGFRTSRADLLSPKSGFNRLWVEYTKEFGATEDVVVVVEGAGRETVVPVLDELADDLIKENRLWNSVLHKIDLAKIRSKGLYYLKTEELVGIEQFLDRFAPLIGGDWSQMNLANMAAEMGKALQFLPNGQGQTLQNQAQIKAVASGIAGFFDSLVVALGERRKYRSPWPDLAGKTDRDLPITQYLLAQEGRMGFIQLKFAQAQKESFTGNNDAVEALRRLVGKAQASHPETRVGLTGLPIIEHDEMSSSESSMTVATVLSILGVMIVVLLGFGGLRHSMLPMGALLLGMIWSLGYTVLTVGHLNILSSAFGAILTGLGINYGIYITARYMQLREANRSIEEALLETSGTVSPGIVVGMIATAVSFYMAGFTEFVGVAELGIIAGGGVLLCCLAAMTVLPAMIYLSDRNRGGCLPQPLEFHRWLEPVCARPRGVLICGAAYTALLALGMVGVWYDHNLLHMQAEGLESVALEQKILSEAGQSASFAISIADDSQTLLARKKQFLQLPSVKNIVEIDSILAADDSMSASALGARRPAIERISRRLMNLPGQAPQIPLAQMEQLGQMFAQVQAMPLGGAEGDYIRRQVQRIGGLLGQLPQAECYARLAEFQQAMAADVLARLYALRSAANPEPPQLSDLPESLVSRFVSPSGKHLMKIYSKGDIWDMQAMKQFVREVRSVDRSVTGNPVQIYEASLQMKRSYEQATWFALCTILPVMFLNLGNLRDTLLAVLPLGLCMLQLLGIMGFLNIPFNPANMISLPLMLGMGVDNGINIVYDFRRQTSRYRMSPSTAVAVILNTLTTMVGFGVLMLADHRGLQSLGRVLTIGMSCCLASSLVILPALLTWITRNRLEQEQTPEPALEEHIESAEEHGESAVDNGEILSFPPPALPEERQEWVRKRSA
jgi:hopanoid biosynthesis associated RND transporter like protein HpnN